MTSANSPAAPVSASGITNIVVLMLENRSYDNVLGWLYGAGNLPPYNNAPDGQKDLNGLSGGDSNPNPYGGKPLAVGNQTSPTGVPGQPQVYPATTIPVVDPGEVFDDMALQYTGAAPETNPYVDGPPVAPNAMSGFCRSYAAQHHVSAANIADVMNYLTPAQLPVTAYLANNFAVCDSWFASAPTQTFANRAFAHCAAPGVLGDGTLGYSSLIDDVQYVIDSVAVPLIELPSLMQYLDANLPAGDGPNWRVYFHDYSISMMTVPYISRAAALSDNANVCTFSSVDYGNQLPSGLGQNPSNFLADVANGTLPPYSFIEPRYSRGHSPANPPPAPNNNHPGPSAYFTVFGVTETDPPIDTASGELLLMQVYNTLRNSQYWPGTLLIVTYDEAGGIYDHVAPVNATPPGTINWGNIAEQPFATLPLASEHGSAVDGFNFNVTGGRVPAILVSPLIPAGTTLTSNNGAPFDHSSLVRTVFDAFCSTSASLNERDAAAPSVLLALDATADNQAAPFSGTILTAPSSLTFHMSLLEDVATQILQTDAGGPALTVSPDASAAWLQVAYSSGTVTVTVNKAGLTWGSLYQASFTIAGADSQDKLAPATIPVTMILGTF